MPWKAIERDDEWCVYQINEDDEPVGETLGCHPTSDEANEQVAALYANEPEAAKTAAAAEPPSTAITVKALDDNRVTLAGWGVIYGGKDLEGETFTKQTDFWLDRITRTPPVLYQHGMDAKAARTVMGKATIDERDIGLWLEAQMDLANEYADAVRELAEAGKLGWSSGAVGHLVEREGRTITSWPIAEFSLTPTPAEPRTLGVHELRALADSEPTVKAYLPEDGEKPSADATKDAPEAVPIESRPSVAVTNVTDRKDLTMADEETKVQEEQVAEPQPETPPTLDPAAFADAAMKQFRELLENEPPLRKAWYSTPEGTDHPENKSFADYLMSIQRGDVKRLQKIYKADLAESAGSTGGYLVPPEYSDNILQLANEMSVVKPRATVIPMTGREWNVPALDYTGSTAGQPAQLGGVVANWTEEAAAKTETQPTFRTIKLIYHELSGYTQASNMLRQDAGPTLEAMLRRLFAEAIAWYEDWAFLRGDGAGKPLGVFNAGCLETEAAGATTCVLSDVANMMSKFLNRPNSAGPTNGAVWLAHPGMLPYLIAMLDGASDTNNIIWIESARDEQPSRLFGIPIIYTDKMPVIPAAAAAANKGGLLLADFSYYLIGTRGQLAIDFSEHYAFVNNQGTWRFCDYVDGQPWLEQSVYRADGSNTCSPFVTLSGA